MTFGVNNFNLELITLIHKQLFKSNTKNADHSIGSYKESENIIHKFTVKTPIRFEAASGDTKLYGVYFEIDEKTGKCTKVCRVEA